MLALLLFVINFLFASILDCW